MGHFCIGQLQKVESLSCQQSHKRYHEVRPKGKQMFDEQHHFQQVLLLTCRTKQLVQHLFPLCTVANL